MSWLNDLFLFLFVPGLVILAALLTHKGSARKYKIVRETNTLGEERYEVWFDYTSPTGLYTWRHEETFDSLDQADQYISRQFKMRETVREGKFE